MLMNNDIELKKDYVAPQMEVVQFELQDRLLQDSPSSSNPPSPPQSDLGCNPCSILLDP